MTDWQIPTLASARGANGPARCEQKGCKRLTTADMLQPFPVALGGGYGCDGCRERAFALGLITRAAYYEALGAPGDLLAALDAEAAEAQ